MGFRGDFLLFLAVIDFAQAVSLLDTGTAGSPSYAWFGSVVALPVWAGLWATAGAVCAFFAFQTDDHVGFVAGIGVKVIWGVGSFAAWLLSDVTVLGGVLWLMFAGAVWRVSMWPEPIDVRFHTGEDRQHDD